MDKPAPAQKKSKKQFNPFLSGLLRALLFLLGTAVSFLPRKVELWIGPLLGRIALLADRKRRLIAHENIRHCLPELGPEGWERLLRDNFRHYGLLGIELLHMFSPFEGHYARYVNKTARLEGFEHLEQALAKGKGVLFLSAHLANWELMAARVGLIGIKITIATRHLKPEWLHKKIEAARRSANVIGAYLPNTLPAILKALRNKEQVGFVLDQYAPPPMGVRVPFFGVLVDTLSGIGTFAQRYGVPIVPVYQYRDGAGVVHVVIEPEFDLGKAVEDPVACTSLLANKVESWIRARPPEWLWAHRRFKNVAWPTEAGSSKE